jgi:hypothetical protein
MRKTAPPVFQDLKGVWAGYIVAQACENDRPA